MTRSTMGKLWKQRIGEFMWLNLDNEGWESVVIRAEMATGIKAAITTSIKNPYIKRGECLVRDHIDREYACAIIHAVHSKYRYC